MLRDYVWTALEWAICKLRIGFLGGRTPHHRPSRVVFLCTGNICRSPFAHALAETHGISVLSCGTDTQDGLTANPGAIACAMEQGVDLTSHRTSRWQSVQLFPSDLVVATELRHLLFVRKDIRSARCQVTLMSALRPGSFRRISDPYGRDPAEFRRVFQLIREAITQLGKLPPKNSHKSTIPQRANVLAFLRAGAKDLFGRTAVAFGIHKRLLSGRAVVVAFHSIVSGRTKDTLRCGAADFESYCRFFIRHMGTLSLSQAIALDRAERDKLGGEVVVTFDDGYADNYYLAKPILDRLKIPATIFVCSDLIGSDWAAPWDASRGISSRWMTWENLRELIRDGFEVGGHTATHADLSTISRESARREMAGSKSMLESRLGVRVRHFAIPYGRSFVGVESFATLAGDLGYESTWLCEGGFRLPSSTGSCGQRIPIDSSAYLTPYGWLFDVLCSR